MEICSGGMLSLDLVCRDSRIAKQVEAHYSAAQSTPKSDALQRNMGRTIPVRCLKDPALAGPTPAYAGDRPFVMFEALS